MAFIRRLSRDVLTKIFMLCMSSPGMSSFDLKHSPLLVGQVCVGWRKVALSTQALWSSITVTHNQPSAKAVNLWISRAMSVPSTIHLDSTVFSRTRHIRPALAALVQYCDRWKDLSLCIEERMVSRLYSIKHRLPWLESLQIQNAKESQSWRLSQELDIFELAPRLRNLSLGHGICHAKLKIPWRQLTELTVHLNNITEGLDILRLVPNLVKCILYNAPSMSEASEPILPPQTLLEFPRLRSFSVLRSVRPNEIFKHLELPIIRALHIECGNEERRDAWFSRQPFMSLLSRSSHTLRKLEIDCLRVDEDTVHIAHCLRAMPSLAELSLRGSGCWITADFLCLLTRLPDIDGLVPDLEVLEMGGHSMPCHECASMIESRWRVTGVHLKKLNIEMVMTEDWLVDAEILKRLRKCRQEGMVISIVDTTKRWNLLDSYEPTDVVD